MQTFKISNFKLFLVIGSTCCTVHLIAESTNAVLGCYMVAVVGFTLPIFMLNRLNLVLAPMVSASTNYICLDQDQPLNQEGSIFSLMMSSLRDASRELATYK